MLVMRLQRCRNRRVSFHVTTTPHEPHISVLLRATYTLSSIFSFLSPLLFLPRLLLNYNRSIRYMSPWSELDCFLRGKPYPFRRINRIKTIRIKRITPVTMPIIPSLPNPLRGGVDVLVFLILSKFAPHYYRVDLPWKMQHCAIFSIKATL